MQTFQDVRSEIDNFLYPDALPCLQALHRLRSVKLIILSNGTANLSRCTLLHPLLSFSICAGDVGASKPSVIPFIAMAQRAGVPPSRILYVGDSEEHDVIGGRAAGMCTALIRRDDPWDQNNGAVARGKGSSADIILRS